VLISVPAAACWLSLPGVVAGAAALIPTERCSRSLHGRVNCQVVGEQKLTRARLVGSAEGVVASLYRNLVMRGVAERRERKAFALTHLNRRGRPLLGCRRRGGHVGIH